MQARVRDTGARGAPREGRVRINRELARVGSIREFAVDISRSGVFLRSLRPRPVGARIELEFTVIMDEIETIRGVGEVVRVAERPAGMGVRFVEIDSPSRDVLARLMARADEAGEVVS